MGPGGGRRGRVGASGIRTPVRGARPRLAAWYHRVVEVDTPLARQARRLALSAELTRRAARRAGERVAPDASAAGLVALARDLTALAAPVERAHRLRFAPPYPGVTGGVEELRNGRRLVLACTAIGAAGAPEAVVFTTLIAGHPPRVAAAPADAPIPAGWTALAPG
jgi:hypothetical protein